MGTMEAVVAVIGGLLVTAAIMAFIWFAANGLTKVIPLPKELTVEEWEARKKKMWIAGVIGVAGLALLNRKLERMNGNYDRNWNQATKVQQQNQDIMDYRRWYYTNQNNPYPPPPPPANWSQWTW